jgi:poly(3-hydroxybutyrate) depolymerase
MMKINKFSILLAAISFIVATLACSALATTPTVSNIRMTKDDTGKTITSSYSPGDAFYVFADLSGLKTGSVVEAKWYAVNATGVDANSEINTSDYTYESGIAYVYFKLTTNDGSDWPSGSYKVELYLDGTKTGELGFNVQ